MAADESRAIHLAAEVAAHSGRCGSKTLQSALISLFPGGGEVISIAIQESWSRRVREVINPFYSQFEVELSLFSSHTEDLPFHCP